MDGVDYKYFRLATLEENGVANVSRLPFSHRILLENLLRHEDGRKVQAADIDAVARGVSGPEAKEITFMPARVLLQDFTGVPAWWISRRCATRSRRWAPIRQRPIR